MTCVLLPLIAVPTGTVLAFALRRKTWGGMVMFLMICPCFLGTDPWIANHLNHHPRIAFAFIATMLTGVVGLFIGMKLEKKDAQAANKDPVMLRDSIDRKLCEQHILKALTALLNVSTVDVRTRLGTMSDDEIESLKDAVDILVGRKGEAS